MMFLNVASQVIYYEAVWLILSQRLKLSRRNVESHNLAEK